MSIIRDDKGTGSVAAVGAVPPPGAPHELAEPLKSELIADQLAQAQRNEQVLPPFKPAGGGEATSTSSATPATTPRPALQPAAPLRVPARVVSADAAVSRGTLVSPAEQRAAVGAPASGVVPAAHVVAGTGTPAAVASGGEGDPMPAAAGGDDPDPTVPVTMPVPITVTMHGPGPDGEPVPQIPDMHTTSALAGAARQLMNQRPALPTDGTPYRPAASDTDSPSRGVPQPIADPGKQITGGWGDVAAASYEPISGDELRVIATALLTSLIQQLHDDLRFSLALTYPRLAVRAVLEVEGYEDGCNFEIPRRFVHDRTPIDLAREVANEFSFVVRAERREFAEGDDVSETPAGAMRAEFGMTGPRKQVVALPGGQRMIVDRPV